jgi:hypothetical protein
VAPSVIAVVLVLALVGGLWVLLGRDDGASVAGPATTSPTPTSTTSATASITPASTPPAPPSSAPATTAATTSAPATSAATEAPAQRPEVVVLNQSGRAGLAGRTATMLRAAGWTVVATGNFRGTVVATTVYYPAGLDDAAAALAADLPGADRIRPVFGNLSTTRLTVVLTSSYPG